MCSSDLEPAGVLGREKPLHVRHRIPVQSFHFLGRKAHRDDARRHVKQVQIKLLIHKSLFVLADKVFDESWKPVIEKMSKI